VGVLINIGVDKLAQAMIGWKTGLAKENTNATQLWGWMAGNISLVKGHPAVAAYYGCVRAHSHRFYSTPIGWVQARPKSVAHGDRTTAVIWT
jgi:hypothetical protein